MSVSILVCIYANFGEGNAPMKNGELDHWDATQIVVGIAELEPTKYKRKL